ncbi:MAG: short-subunit dehydrogenase [Myxococcota bacterium]|jgi:short-subunit dehydrogenase
MNFNLTYGPWAIVTGASAGLGEHYTRQLAERGLNVLIIARRMERLESLATELMSKHSVSIECLELDLVAEGAISTILTACEGKDIGLLVNNAGFGIKELFTENDAARLRNMVRLNCEVPVMLTDALLGKLKSRDTAGIINLSSVAGFQATPHMSVYGATKAFDLMFSEALGSELEGSGIDVLAVCPASTATEFHVVAGSESTFPTMDDPRLVVRNSLNSLGKRAVYVHGFKSRALIFVSRFTPRFLVTKMTKLMLKN